VAVLSTGGDAAKQAKKAALPLAMARRASGTVSLVNMRVAAPKRYGTKHSGAGFGKITNYYSHRYTINKTN
jgi:hypothetical protein